MSTEDKIIAIALLSIAIGSLTFSDIYLDKRIDALEQDIKQLQEQRK